MRAITLALVASLGCAAPAGAIGDRTVDPTVEISPDGVGGGFGVGNPGPDNEGKPPAELKYVVLEQGTCMLGVLPNADGSFATIWGRFFVTILVDGDGSEQVVDAGCIPDGDPPPAPPPPPPSPAEVWGFVPLADSKIGVSPGGDGLTGLATLLWYDGPRQPVTLGPLNLRGYSLTATVRPVSYRWRMGNDPDPAKETTYRTRTAGSPEEPAVSHVYERKGDYTLRMEVMWQGTYTFSGFGVTTDRALGGVTVVRTRPYHVAEARSVRP